MPLYFFHVRDGQGGFADQDGTELPDVRSAMSYARDLARELMRGNESRKRHWHVVVCDADGNDLFDVPFITADDSIRHLNPESRRLLETMCEQRIALAEALFETRMNVLRARASIARSRAQPYIAAEFGHAVVKAEKQKT
jgi:Domain of unknown function (DUF6894)